jgi:hypothetical protein
MDKPLMLPSYSLIGLDPKFTNILDAFMVNGQLVITAGFQAMDRGIRWHTSMVIDPSTAQNFARGLLDGFERVKQGNLQQAEVAGHG